MYPKSGLAYKYPRLNCLTYQYRNRSEAMRCGCCSVRQQKIWVFSMEA